MNNTSNKCKALSGEQRKVCVRERRGRGRNNIMPDDYFSDAILDITWTHCPNHSAS